MKGCDKLMNNILTMFWGIREKIWSHKRFIATFVCVTWTVVLQGMYIAACYSNRGMVTIPSSVVTMYLTMIGSVMGISVGASILDKKADKGGAV